MPGYLETIGAHLIAGTRISRTADHHGAAQVAVISQQELPRRYFYGSAKKAMGRTVKNGRRPSAHHHRRTRKTSAMST